MNLRVTVLAGEPPREVEVILRSRNGGPAEGKYVLGRTADEERRLVVAFDDSAAFHRDIGVKYGIRPIGGGWMVLDQKGKRAQVSGRSTQYGRELDRDLVVEALSAALVGFNCQRLD